MRVQIDDDERYPVYFVAAVDDESADEDQEFNAEMTAQELADYRRVLAEYYAWQDKLARLGGYVMKGTLR